MRPKASSASSPAIAPVSDHQEQDAMVLTGARRWIQKVVDVEEAKNQMLFSLPMILTNLFYYFIPLISVMFAGHLGHLQLAGATLANSWATVTGFAFMTGLSGSLETLCGQGFGARRYNMLGIYLQSSCIISFIVCIVISVFWLYTAPVLVFLHQDPLIAEQAAVYMKFLIPGLFAYGLLQNMLRTNLGFTGASLSASVSLWISAVLLGIYLINSDKFKQTWIGLSFESFSYILTNLKLSLPSAAMVCLEFWAFEILVFMAGVMPNAQISTSLIAICANTENIAYMLTYGLSAAASTRVSNELGAGNADRAKKAMFVTIKLSVLLALGVVLALVAGHNVWAGFFSNSPTILKEFGSMTPFLAVSIALDSVQGVLSGVARGCGWQHLAVCINLAMFYFVGTPVAALLGFKFKLYVRGLWIGLVCGLFCQAAGMLLLTSCRNWRNLYVSVATEAA